MSHKATNWLAGLDADLIGASEFRVLFHLCDCHNPSQGCFPTQGYLMSVTGVSNGTLNNALRAMEQKGLIRRHRTFDSKSRRQKPTRYVLGFELPKPQEPSPEYGDGAVSSPLPDPSPVSGQSRLQPTGEEPVKEPVNNLARASGAGGFAAKTIRAARFWADTIRADRFVPQTAITEPVAACILAEKMISDELAAKHGLFRGGKGA